MQWSWKPSYNNGVMPEGHCKAKTCRIIHKHIMNKVYQCTGVHGTNVLKNFSFTVQRYCSIHNANCQNITPENNIIYDYDLLGCSHILEDHNINTHW